MKRSPKISAVGVSMRMMPGHAVSLEASNSGVLRGRPQLRRVSMRPMSAYAMGTGFTASPPSA